MWLKILEKLYELSHVLGMLTLID